MHIEDGFVWSQNVVTRDGVAASGEWYVCFGEKCLKEIGSKTALEALALDHASKSDESSAPLASLRDVIARPPAKWAELSGGTDAEKKRKNDMYKGLKMKILAGPYKNQLCEFRQCINDDNVRVALHIKSTKLLLFFLRLIIIINMCRILILYCLANCREYYIK